MNRLSYHIFEFIDEGSGFFMFGLYRNLNYLSRSRRLIKLPSTPFLHFSKPYTTTLHLLFFYIIYFDKLNGCTIYLL